MAGARILIRTSDNIQIARGVKRKDLGRRGDVVDIIDNDAPGGFGRAVERLDGSTPWTNEAGDPIGVNPRFYVVSIAAEDLEEQRALFLPETRDEDERARLKMHVDATPSDPVIFAALTTLRKTHRVELTSKRAFALMLERET